MKNLDVLLGYVVETLEKSTDFVIEQAPIAVQQLMAWHVASSLMTIGIMLAVILASIMVPYFLWKKWNKAGIELYEYEYEDTFDILKWVAIIIGGIALLVIAKQAYILVKISTAPSIVLIEYIQKVL